MNNNKNDFETRDTNEAGGKVFIVFEPADPNDERGTIKIPFDFDKIERLPNGNYWCYGEESRVPYARLYDSNFNPIQMEFESSFPSDEEEYDEPK